MLLNCVFVGLGGAAGSICRYLLGLLPLKPASGFPAITLCINIAGAFALGLIGALAGKYAKLNPQLLLGLFYPSVNGRAMHSQHLRML